jgi:hypothetical protein
VRLVLQPLIRHQALLSVLDHAPACRLPFRILEQKFHNCCADKLLVTPVDEPGAVLAGTAAAICS